MGMMDRFGRIADTYISERNKLLEADTERRRTFTGHPFWPTEVLRDTIIFASIVMTIAFYSWLIPLPCIVRLIHSRKLVSYSPIGTFCFHTDT